MSSDKWLNLDLTNEQQFELEKVKRMLPNASRTDLEQFALLTLEQSFKYLNAFKSVLKDKHK